jgi:hypothetical protein
MSQVAPTSARFFVSDDIRDETSGKMSIIGLYADDKIYTQPMPGFAPPQGFVAVVAQLCISCVLIGGSGRFAVKAVVISPSGAKMVEQLFDLVLDPNRTATVGIRGNGLAFQDFGAYECQMIVGNRTFTHDFHVLAGPPPVSTGTPPPPAPPQTAKTSARRPGRVKTLPANKKPPAKKK